jgi:subtilisin-like proprotein convertase family protein
MAERTTYLPTDPLFGLQWHLHNTGQITGAVSGQDINVVQVWPDYTGQGIVIAVFDDGVDHTHPDLAANYLTDLSRDLILNIPGALPVSLDDDHGTSVAGLIGASANNGIGGVGVAWNASLIGYRDVDSDLLADRFSRATMLMLDADVDISSNSWGEGAEAVFGANAEQPIYIESVMNLATFGREGLGTVVLFSAGNDRKNGYNTNQDPTNNIPYSINVAAGLANGLIADYSTPGASVLVTAPGSEPASIVTTDRQGSSGYNSLHEEAGNYTDTNDSYFNGTSASAPIAAGVVALILEANPLLGYRDIQEILVYSSRRAVFLDVEGIQSDYNQAVDWNGGGLLTSYDFGFGNIDAHAAVRLAETWQKTSTTNNLELIEGDVLSRSLVITAGGQAQAVAVFAQDNRVEQVTVSIDLQTERLQDVILELVSPGGTRSILIDRPPIESDPDDLTPPVVYTLNTVRAWGESLQGEWTLQITNAETGAPITLNSWSIKAHAADHTTPSTQIFTDEFATFAALETSRLTINANNGADLNASAVTEDSVLDLSGGGSTIGGVDITLTELDGFRNLITGDGDDYLIGNEFGNDLYGGWGSDFLVGGLGNDDIDGGEGIDYAVYAASISTTIAAAIDANGLITIRTPFGTDTLSNIESVAFSDDTVSIEELLGGYAPPVYQTNAGQITANIYAGPVDFLHFQMLGTTSGDIVNGSSGNDFVNMLGGDDAVSGGAGQDVLDGGVGSNFLTGGAEADTFFLDGRGGSITWSTITDFSSEDSVNIWGWQQGTSQLILSFDQQGADGFKGATFHYDLNGNGLIDTSITFSNLTLASMPSPIPDEVAGNGYLLFA